MTERTQLGTRILKESKALLAQMAADDLRSFREELEWLIREEHNRRNAPANTLVDRRVGYHDVDEFYLEKEPE